MRGIWSTIAAVLCLLALVYSLFLVGAAVESGGSTAWFVTGSILAALVIGAVALRVARFAAAAVAFVGVVLVLVGVSAILSVGAPLFVGGLLAVAAAAWSRYRAPANQ